MSQDNHIYKIIAASALLLVSQTALAADFPQSPLQKRALTTNTQTPPSSPNAGFPLLTSGQAASPNAPAATQERWPQPFDLRGTQHAVFNFIVGTPGKISVNVQSQGDPVVRFLVKPSGEPLYLQAATFEYLVTAEDISKGQQWKLDVYLPAQKTAQGLFVNPNGHANGTVNIQHPPADTRTGAGSTAMQATEQSLNVTPAALSSIPVHKRPGTVELTSGPIDINGRFTPVQQTPIQHRAFTLEEVFDVQTGKPIFSVNELNGELQLPHGPKVSVSHAPQSDADVLRRKGINTFTVARGGVFRLKTESGRQVVTIPRQDGNSITVPAELFLREVNAYERNLNARGMTMRDSRTGKISATPRTMTVSRLNVNVLLLKQQYLDNEKKLIKGVTAKTWDSADVFSRHKNALDHIPPARRDQNNRLISAPLSSFKTTPSKSNILAKANAITDVTKHAPSAIADKYQKCVLVQDASNQPDGGVSGEAVTINIAKYDASVCILSFEDGAGRRIDAAATPISPTQVRAVIPAGLKNGIGSIVLSERATPAVSMTPFYVGTVCSIESVYPPKGMADTELVLKVGRFKNCSIRFADPLSGHTPSVTYAVVDNNTITAKVPNFTIGNDTIEAARQFSDSAGRQQPVNTSLAFRIQATVADVNGNAPPPDYFSEGIKPFERKYEWVQPYGDPSSFAVDAFANLSIYSKGAQDDGDNKVNFEGKGGARGTLFNNTAEIIAVNATASVPTANSQDSKMRANLTVTAGPGGHPITLYTWKRNRDKDTGSTDESATTCDASHKDKNGKCCDDIKPDKTCGDDGLAVQVQIKYQNDFRLPPVDYSASTNFTVGPVPMVARFGFHGDAGAKVNFALSPLQAIGQITPYVHTSVYGESGVEVLFATAGVGVDMILANMELDAAGQVYLDFGQMALVSQMYVNLDYDFLDGSVYAFVDGFGHRMKQDIFNINELASQATGVNLVFKGHSYLLAPQTVTFPLLSGGA